MRNNLAKGNATRFSLYCRVALFVLCCTLTAWAAKKLTGGIFTTTSNGTKVNANLYPAKTDVYLNGGPQNTNSSGLPPGTYYFQVTNVPANGNNAVLLSADDIGCRKVIVGANDRIDGAAPVDLSCGIGGQVPGMPLGTLFAAGAIHPNGTQDTGNLSTPVQLCPATTRASDNLNNGPQYDSSNWCDTTPNPGGEYKVWLTPITKYDPVNCTAAYGFCPDFSKTDNFKIKPRCTGTGCIPPSSIVWPLGGEKFYDANTDGINNNDAEPIIDGWQVRGVKSCQEDQSILSALLGGATLPINDADFTIPPPNPYGRQFQYTHQGQFETEAFQDPLNPVLVTLDGYYQFRDLNAGGHYSVCEIIPLGAASLFPTGLSTLSGKPKWFATSATEHDNIFLPTVSADFGNVCTGAGGGLTLGFWSNTNGESVMAYGPAFPTKVAKSCNTTADNSTGMKATLAFLSTFNLVNAKGTYINPSTMGYCAFRTWLLGATSTNSAYMLSAQLASMELNVHFGYVSGSALIYAPGTNSANNAGFATVADVMAEANDSLGTNPYVVVNNLLNNNVTLKAYQVALKNALDNANNNLGFVQPGPGSCAISYLDESVNSCITADAPSGTTNIWQPVPQNPDGSGTGCAVNSLIQLLTPPQP